MDIKKEFYQGIPLHTQSYYVKIVKKGFKTQEFWINVNSQDLHIQKSIIKL